MDKGGAPFIGWNINTAGLFPWDKDINCYLFVTMESFFMWVETHAMPLLHSWRIAKFLYDNPVAHCGNPCCI